MQITLCNECKKEFIVQLEELDVGEGLRKIYFSCPHCQEEYLVHYSTVLIERKQWKARKLQEEIKQTRGKDPQKALKLHEKFQKLKKQIGKDMEFLRRRVESR